METLGELLARERRSERVACRVGTDTRRYDYADFLTTAWQSGNYLRHLGVREGVTVGIAPDPVPEALLAALGTGLLGATAWFDPPEGADLRAIVAPAGEIEAYGPRPGRSRVGYGGDTDDPAIERFEEGVWSENPTMPPERPGGETAMLTDGDRTFPQRELLRVGSELADGCGIDSGTDVVLRASLADPRTVVGVLATLLAAGTTVFPESEEPNGDVTIGIGPEPTVIGLERIGVR
ncbi:MAG: hypothetical protein ABEH88_11555 [Halobacteriales archaeon]